MLIIQHLQLNRVSSSSANANCKVTVDGVTPLANGTLQMSYTCSGVSDHDSCHSSLDSACKGVAVQQTVSKCSSSDDTEAKSQTRTTAKKAAATTAAAKSGGASVDSHVCGSTDSTTVKGTITLKNCDQTVITAQKDTLCQALTSHVQSSGSSNAKTNVLIDGITKLIDGTLQMNYTCSGVGDHDSCQSSLKAATGSDSCQKIISQCSTDGSGTTAHNVQATTTTKKTADTTKAGTTTSKKPVTTAPGKSIYKKNSFVNDHFFSEINTTCN
jgi:hypothetical protein